MSARQSENLKRKPTNRIHITGNLEKKIICFTILLAVIIILVISILLNYSCLINYFENRNNVKFSNVKFSKVKDSNINLNNRSDFENNVNITVNKHRSIVTKIVSKLKLNKKKKLDLSNDTIINSNLCDLTLYKKFCSPMKVINTKYINLAKRIVDTLISQVDSFLDLQKSLYVFDKKNKYIYLY